MAKERRQFIGLTDTQAESFNGLDREITVSTDSDTLRLHTTEEPHGILLAKKTEVINLSSDVNQLTETVGGLNTRLTTLETSMTNGDVRAFIHNFNFICNEATTDPDISSVYPYKDDIAFDEFYNVDGYEITATVYFSAVDALSGNFAPLVKVDADTQLFTIYSKTEMTETHSAHIVLSKLRKRGY